MIFSEQRVMKPEDLAIVTYLKDAAASGSMDSQGVFTVSGPEAISKLANFQLPRKSAWILKIIQCAVAFQAQHIIIKQAKDTTLISFQGEQTFDLEAFGRALADPKAELPRYLNHLLSGLRAVGFGDKRPFLVRVTHEGYCKTLCWAGAKLTQESTEAPKASGALVQLVIDFPAEDQGRQLGGLLRTAGRARDEYTEVAQFAESCPIPLTFDGRRIDTLEFVAQDGLNVSTRNLAIAWIEPTPDWLWPTLTLPPSVRSGFQANPQSPPNFLTQDSVLRSFTGYGSPGFFFASGNPRSSTCSSLIKVIFHYNATDGRIEPRQAYSRVHWLVDGVICESQKMTWGTHAVSVGIYVSGDGMPTDLSGLSFREEARLEQQQRLNLVVPHISPLATKTMEAIHRYRAIPLPLPLKVLGGVSLVGFVATIFMPQFLILTLLSGAGLAIGARFSLNKSQDLTSDCLVQLSRLEERCRRFYLAYKSPSINRIKKPNNP